MSMRGMEERTTGELAETAERTERGTAAQTTAQGRSLPRSSRRRERDKIPKQHVTRLKMLAGSPWVQSKPCEVVSSLIAPPPRCTMPWHQHKSHTNHVILKRKYANPHSRRRTQRENTHDICISRSGLTGKAHHHRHT